ncbi:hypothetical protein N5079_23025 [Planotetraspora sp. A-T 1434]|uniref:hypothetical protein n=1 Tax=Planotetraspora sp. A-T 1434 TaxID=2979219 RepID=UPI0021C16D9B|nr:hypothetical protein [Planotetraspora sp. A-T 1434]MCT9933085.1 hypothetical protein [Planotetraspora sp. A-T 1434]
MSRSRIDRLCRHRDVPVREKTLWRMLYESASRASAVLALNIEDLDLPNKQARGHRQGRRHHVDHLGHRHRPPAAPVVAGRQRGPLFLSEYRPGPHRRATTDPDGICPETGRAGWATTAPGSCSATTATASDSSKGPPEW